jgi:hypothetical protein
MDLLKISAGLGVSYCATKFFFPIEVKTLTNYLLYKSFCVYSGGKYYIKRIANKITNNMDKKKLYFVKNGIKVLELTISTMDELKEFEKRINDDIEYDMLFYVNRNNYVRYNKLEDFLNCKLIYNCDFVNFINVILSYADKEYELDLKTDNYYIENNVLFDNIFMQYYLLKYHDIIFDNKIEYTIKILDNNFQEMELTNKQYLIIQETNKIEDVIDDKGSDKGSDKSSSDNLDMCADEIPRNELSQNTGWFSFMYSK